MEAARDAGGRRDGPALGSAALSELILIVVEADIERYEVGVASCNSEISGPVESRDGLPQECHVIHIRKDKSPTVCLLDSLFSLVFDRS